MNAVSALSVFTKEYNAAAEKLHNQKIHLISLLKKDRYSLEEVCQIAEKAYAEKYPGEKLFDGFVRTPQNTVKVPFNFQQRVPEKKEESAQSVDETWELLERVDQQKILSAIEEESSWKRSTCRQLWNRLLQLLSTQLLAHEFFVTHFLHRISDTQILRSIPILETMQQCFSSSPQVQEWWQILSKNRQAEYYSFKELSSLCSHFGELLSLSKNFSSFPSPPPSLRPWNEGGESWLARLIYSIKRATRKEEQLRACAELPQEKKLIDQLMQRGYPLALQSMSAGAAFRGKITENDLLQAESLLELRSLSICYLTERSSYALIEEYHSIWEEIKEKPSSLRESDQIKVLLCTLLSNENLTFIGSLRRVLHDAGQIKRRYSQKLFELLFDPSEFIRSRRKNTLFNLVSICDKLLKGARKSVPLKEWMKRKNLSLNELCQELEKSLQDENQEIEEVLYRWGTEDGELKEPLSGKELLSLREEYDRVLFYEEQLRTAKSNLLQQVLSTIQIDSSSSREHVYKLLALAREMMRRLLGITPYPHQILAVLGLLNHSSAQKGRIAQVRTGEGKSTIITLLATLLALRGESVDIITSSRYLAQRDWEKYAPYFAFFGLSSSHICSDQPTAAHFSGQILYGTNSDFEFSLLRQWVYDDKARGKRPFHHAIIDEVDNLLIDRSMDSARIAIPHSQSRRELYEGIFRWVKENPRIAFPLEESVDLREILPIEIPREISDGQLRRWVQSAYQALYLFKENVHYCIRSLEKRTLQGKVTCPSIVIVDHQHTGRLQEGSRWQGGLHEFLELKAGLTLQEESLTAASLSHPIFFSRFKNLYGVTGTLGTLKEREELRTIYSVDTFDVPTRFPNCREQFPLKLCEKAQFFSAILDDIREKMIAHRPTLILFPTIEQCEQFSVFLKNQEIPHSSLTSLQKEQEEMVISQAALPRQITLATNTAGRGTDIVPSTQALKAGGLHLILTFYPSHLRVEEQAIGRTGRQGNPGSYRIILSEGDKVIEQLQPWKKLIESFLECRIQSQLPDGKALYTRLHQLRLEQMERESQIRSVHAQLERIGHCYVEQFFTQFAKWRQTMKGETVLKERENILKIWSSDHTEWAECFPNLSSLSFTSEEIARLLETYDRQIQKLFETTMAKLTGFFFPER